MFTAALYPNTKKVLALLAKEDFIKQFYLAGGTALALQLGHRRSIDLDFFSTQAIKSDNLAEELAKLGNFTVQQKDDKTLIGELNKVRVSFFYYPFNLLKPARDYIVKLADPVDVGLMKITAIADRGSQKDFIDLFKICQEIINLKDLFNLLPKKFASVKYEPYYLIKGLTYFKDAEGMPWPDMLQSINWSEIKVFFEENSKKLLTDI